MTTPPGRRERKKAATREKIATTAVEMFLEHGFDAVGIRDVAAEADVAVTTVFSHFASKEALVFEKDGDFQRNLTLAVTDRAPDQPLIPALRHEIEAQVRHCTTASAAPIWRMIDASTALQDYGEAMRLRHTESLAAALAADSAAPLSTTATRTIARFVVDAFALAREAPDPVAALDEIFLMIEAAWDAVRPRGAR